MFLFCVVLCLFCFFIFFSVGSFDCDQVNILLADGVGAGKSALVNTIFSALYESFQYRAVASDRCHLGSLDSDETPDRIVIGLLYTIVGYLWLDGGFSRLFLFFFFSFSYVSFYCCFLFLYCLFSFYLSFLSLQSFFLNHRLYLTRQRNTDATTIRHNAIQHNTKRNNFD